MFIRIIMNLCHIPVYPSALQMFPLYHVFLLVSNISLSPFVLNHPHSFPHSNPFLASSTLRADSPALNPPLDTQILLPSPSSNLSSCESQLQGQWCGKWTQASVSGHRYLSQLARDEQICQELGTLGAERGWRGQGKGSCEYHLHWSKRWR